MQDAFKVGEGEAVREARHLPDGLVAEVAWRLGCAEPRALDLAPAGHVLYGFADFGPHERDVGVLLRRGIGQARLAAQPVPGVLQEQLRALNSHAPDAPGVRVLCRGASRDVIPSC